MLARGRSVRGRATQASEAEEIEIDEPDQQQQTQTQREQMADDDDEVEDSEKGREGVRLGYRSLINRTHGKLFCSFSLISR